MLSKLIPVVMFCATLISCVTAEKECLQVGYRQGSDGFYRCVNSVKAERRSGYAAASPTPTPSSTPTSSGDIMDVDHVIGKQCSSDYDCTGPMVRCQRPEAAQLMDKGTCVMR